MRPALAASSDEVAGVRIPKTAFATRAAEYARAALEPVLVGHAHRVFVFAALAARRENRACDAERLFVAAMYANMGLSAAYARSTERYEVDSANAARSLLAGASPRVAEDVWRAIALHTTPGVPVHVSALAHLLAQGAGTDLIGMDYDAYTCAERNSILAAWPRGETFDEDMIRAIARGVAHRPHTTSGTWSADILARTDPDYCRLNFCGLILGSRWNQPGQGSAFHG
ncbi:phosphohydrolase [Paraburkholderia pallida]|uniref:Phosphohydrolase n=1 Tax=Paraburkholderia pallida TaxID=2547399 RepID=A0A4P7CZW7_9BURK|nr:phosphohydrolase [Paraburkholderia pallida]QBR01929.1 phosphohydrolase [Paraburkholderia pallida]